MNAIQANAGTPFAEVIGGSDGLNRLTRYAHTDFYLRTPWHPLDDGADVRYERVFALVTPVVTHLVAQKAS